MHRAGAWGRWAGPGGRWGGAGAQGRGLTEILQDAVALQLCVADLVLQQNQLLLVLVLERLQPPLAVLQLVDQLLLNLDLTRQVGQVGLEVHLCGAETGLTPGKGEGPGGLSLVSFEQVVTTVWRK